MTSFTADANFLGMSPEDFPQNHDEEVSYIVGTGELSHTFDVREGYDYFLKQKYTQPQSSTVSFAVPGNESRTVCGTDGAVLWNGLDAWQWWSYGLRSKG